MAKGRADGEQKSASWSLGSVHPRGIAMVDCSLVGVALVELFVLAHRASWDLLSLVLLPAVNPLCWRARLCCFCARIVEAWLCSWSRSLCYRTPLARCVWLELHSAVLLQSGLLLEDLLCTDQGRV